MRKMSLRKSKSYCRLGITTGFLAVVALLSAFTNNFWLYTYEPVVVDGSKDIETIATFRIGLWTVCSMFMDKMHVNKTFRTSLMNCKSIKYFESSEISIGTESVRLTNAFIAQMRISTPLLSLSLFLLMIATIFALISYYCSIDYRTIVACGLFILAGLSLGSGLFVYAVTVSDTYLTTTNHNTRSELKRHHRYEFSYGWCFFTAALALLLSEFSVFFLIMGYTKRFSTVEQMVYKTIPGAKRKLNEIMVAMRTLQPDVGREVKDKLITRPDNRKSGSKIEPEKEIGITPTPDLCATNEQLQHLFDQKHKYFTLQNHLKTQSISTYPQLSCYYQHQQLQHPYHTQNHHHNHHQHRHHRNYNTIQIPKQKASVRFVNVLPAHRNDDDDDDDEQGSAV